MRARPAVCTVVLEVQRDSCGSDPVTDSSCVWDAANINPQSYKTHDVCMVNNTSSAETEGNY